LKGGQAGSPNHILIRRASGETERHAVTSGLTLNTDDVIQVMTGTGAGWGNPYERPVERVQEDLKNDYITAEMAEKDYGVLIAPDSLEVIGVTEERKGHS
jgi:N-methylhydantoinase B